MLSTVFNFRRAVVSAVAAVVSFAAAAAGGDGVTFELIVDGGAPQAFALPGEGVGDGVLLYANTHFGAEYVVGWSVQAKASGAPFLSGNVVVTNSADLPKNFELSIELPLDAAITPECLIGGSIAGGLIVPPGGGWLTPLDAETPIWRALIDDASVASLLGDDSGVLGVTAGAYIVGPAAFGEPAPSAPGPPIHERMSIVLAFQLSPGAHVALTQVFAASPVPSPADLNGDGVVDGADLGILLNSWGPCVGCPADLDGNGVVDGADVGILLSEWSI